MQCTASTCTRCRDRDASEPHSPAPVPGRACPSRPSGWCLQVQELAAATLSGFLKGLPAPAEAALRDSCLADVQRLFPSGRASKAASPGALPLAMGSHAGLHAWCPLEGRWPLFAELWACQCWALYPRAGVWQGGLSPPLHAEHHPSVKLTVCSSFNKGGKVEFRENCIPGLPHPMSVPRQQHQSPPAGRRPCGRMTRSSAASSRDWAAFLTWTCCSLGPRTCMCCSKVGFTHVIEYTPEASKDRGSKGGGGSAW